MVPTWHWWGLLRFYSVRVFVKLHDVRIWIWTMGYVRDILLDATSKVIWNVQTRFYAWHTLLLVPWGLLKDLVQNVHLARWIVLIRILLVLLMSCPNSDTTSCVHDSLVEVQSWLMLDLALMVCNSCIGCFLAVRRLRSELSHFRLRLVPYDLGSIHF